MSQGTSGQERLTVVPMDRHSERALRSCARPMPAYGPDNPPDYDLWVGPASLDEDGWR